MDEEPITEALLNVFIHAIRDLQARVERLEAAAKEAELTIPTGKELQ